MRVAFASVPAYGHVYPMMPLAAAFEERGHDVHIACGPPFAECLPFPTVEGFPSELTMSAAEKWTAGVELDSNDPFAAPLAMFGTYVGSRTRESLREIWSRHAPDLVVYEMTNIGAALAAADLGIESVPFAITRWEGFPARLFAESGVSPSLMIDPLPRTWRGPDSPVSPKRIDTRTVAWSQPNEGARWPSTAKRVPRAYITMGTVSFGAVDDLRTAVLGATSAGFDVLVSIGPRGERSALGPLPDSVRVENFVDQPCVLSNVDVVVHHGGTGTTLGALERGLPQVVIPQAADQFANAARLTELGIGRRLPIEFTSETARSAVFDVTNDSRARSSLHSIRQEIADTSGPNETCQVLESVVGARSA